MSKRALVGAILVALAAVALWAGGMGYWLVVAVVAVLMMREWAALAKATPAQGRLAQYALFVPLALMCPWAAGPGFLALGGLMGVVFFLGATTRNAQLAAGALYIGLPVLALLLLRAQDPQGLLLAFWAMALVWACDIGAFFAGRAIGGPRLAPAISPSKTWAGLAGGVAAAGLFAWALAEFAGLPLRLAVATPFLAALSQLGDLYESQLKRIAGVKDSGTILPGHGGLMDRLDGLVPVAPAAAIAVLLPQWLA